MTVPACSTHTVQSLPEASRTIQIYRYLKHILSLSGLTSVVSVKQTTNQPELPVTQVAYVPKPCIPAVLD